MTIGAPDKRDAWASESQASKARGSRLWVYLRIIFSISVIVYILFNFDIASVVDVIKSADFLLLFCALVTQMISSSIRALRWQGLLAVRDVDPGWRYLFVSVLSAIFFRQFMPSTIGGDAIRGYDSWKAGASPELSLTALVVDRVLGLAALAIFVGLAVVIWSDSLDSEGQLLQWALIFLAAIAALLVVVFGKSVNAPTFLLDIIRSISPKIHKSILSVGSEFAQYRTERWLMVRALILSIALQANVVVFYWIIARAIGIDISFGALLIIIPFAIVVMMAPVSINGIGIREGVFILLLGFWGVSAPEALAFAWVEYGLVIVYGLLGGIVYSMRGITFLRNSPYGRMYKQDRAS